MIHGRLTRNSTATPPRLVRHGAHDPPLGGYEGRPSRRGPLLVLRGTPALWRALAPRCGRPVAERGGCTGGCGWPGGARGCAWANRERVANSWGGLCGLSLVLTPRDASGERRLISKRRAASADARARGGRTARAHRASASLASTVILLNLPCRGRFLLNLLRRIGPFPHPHSGAPRRPPFC